MSKFVGSYIEVDHEHENVKINGRCAAEICLICRFLLLRHAGDECPWNLTGYYQQYSLRVKDYEEAYFKYYHELSNNDKFL